MEGKYYLTLVMVGKKCPGFRSGHPLFPLPRPCHLRPEDESDAGIVDPEKKGKKEAEGSIELTEVNELQEVEAESVLGHLPEDAGCYCRGEGGFSANSSVRHESIKAEKEANREEES